MVRIYCDRCKKQISTYSRPPYFSEKLTDLNDGEYFGEIRRVTKFDDGSVVPCVDICPKCQKELNELVTQFMISNAKKR